MFLKQKLKVDLHDYGSWEIKKRTRLENGRASIAGRVRRKSRHIRSMKKSRSKNERKRKKLCT